MTSGRLLVMGAGSAAAENLIHSLRSAEPSLVLVGGNEDRFVLKHSSADARYVVPAPKAHDFIRRVRGLVRAERVDLVIPTADQHVQALSAGRRLLPGKVFLPPHPVVELCRDKYALTAALRRRGLPAPATHRVSRLDAIERIFDRFGQPTRLWCRPRTGTCARGGAAVSSAEQARSWIRLWEAMQGLSASSFTLSEYLPGREILCQSVWQRGRLVLANTFERLSYFGVDNIPSGVTSLSSLAKTVVEPGVVDLCRRAVRAVAPRASGAFSIDVKEDAEGRPHVTEINAGRFFMAMTAFDRVLKHSIALTYVRLALGESVEFGEEYDAVEDYFMVRDLDMAPGIFHGDELFEDIEESAGVAQPPDCGSTSGRERRHGNGSRPGRGGVRGHRAARGPGVRAGVRRLQEGARQVRQGTPRRRSEPGSAAGQDEGTGGEVRGAAEGRMTRRGREVRRRSIAKRQLTMRVTGDRKAAELLQLGVRRLARRLGLPVAAVRIRRVKSGAS